MNKQEKVIKKLVDRGHDMEDINEFMDEHYENMATEAYSIYKFSLFMGEQEKGHYKKILEKTMKDYQLDLEQAKQALDICADFNVFDEKDLFSNYLPIVIHTIKRMHGGA